MFCIQTARNRGYDCTKIFRYLGTLKIRPWASEMLQSCGYSMIEFMADHHYCVTLSTLSEFYRRNAKSRYMQVKLEIWMLLLLEDLIQCLRISFEAYHDWKGGAMLKVIEEIAEIDWLYTNVQNKLRVAKQLREKTDARGVPCDTRTIGDIRQYGCDLIDLADAATNLIQIWDGWAPTDELTILE